MGVSAKPAPHIDARSAEAAERIRDCYSAIRQIQSQIADPEKLDAERKRHVYAIAQHQQQVDNIDDLLIHGELRIAALRDEILEAQQIQADSRKRQDNKQIASLLDIARELAANGIDVASLLDTTQKCCEVLTGKPNNAKDNANVKANS